jgi:hypothetical protein
MGPFDNCRKSRVIDLRGASSRQIRRFDSLALATMRWIRCG